MMWPILGFDVDAAVLEVCDIAVTDEIYYFLSRAGANCLWPLVLTRSRTQFEHNSFSRVESFGVF